MEHAAAVVVQVFRFGDRGEGLHHLQIVGLDGDLQMDNNNDKMY